jgi:Xaa-Pro aminopeptidase
MIKNTLLTVSEFNARRTRFLAKMPSNSIALFPAGKEVTRSNDTEYAFCQDKNFYYLTGFNEPDAVLVMLSASQSSSAQAILFCRDKDPLQEIWHGRRIGFECAEHNYGFEQAFALSELTLKVPEFINQKTQLLYCQGSNKAFEQQIFSWLDTVKAKTRQGGKAPSVIVDCSEQLAEMRLIKSADEMAIMRKVNIISGAAHQRAMLQSKAGKFEYQIEAEILHEFALNGARYAAYGSIVAGGDNANILHYTDNDDSLKNNELLLIDAGGELAGYAADITRTFPVNGVFTEAQKTIYQLVLQAQNLAINAIKPQATFAQLNKLVGNFLTQALFELGILTGDLAQLKADNACKKYFIHGLGHWLGLDVHDVGDYHINTNKEQLRAFKPGMVMTIEPGLYFPLSDHNVAEKYRGIGIRIEDNILVTDQGHENLTVNAPKSITDIEKLMAHK